YHILDHAEQLAVDDHEMVKKRIAFLRDGLRNLEMTRDIVRYGMVKTRPEGATKEEFVRLSDQMKQFREEISKRHVINADMLSSYEFKRIATEISQTTGWGSSSLPGEGSADQNKEYEGL